MARRGLLARSLLLPLAVASATLLPASAHHETAAIVQVFADPRALMPAAPLAGIAPAGGGSGTSGWTRIVYFLPAGYPPAKRLDTATIAASVSSLVDWLKAQVPDRTPLIDTGAVRVVDGRHPAAEYRAAGPESYLSQIASELADRGYDTERYLIYAAIPAEGICGEAHWPGRYGALYVDAVHPGCGARDFGRGTAASAGRAEAVLAHEWLHTAGVVPVGAPHHCPITLAHVCTGSLALVRGLDPEEADLMFPAVTAPLRDKVLDRDRARLGGEDYYQHARSSGLFG